MKYYLAYIILFICLSSCANPIEEIPKEESKNLDKIKTVEIENRTSYQPDSARFQDFVNNFPLLEEFTIDQNLLQATSNLPRIKPEDVFDFIYQIDSSDYGKEIEWGELPLKSKTYGHYYLPKKSIESGAIQFYYFGKIKLFDQMNSLIFAVDDTSDYGMNPVSFMLFNYDFKGKLIAEFTIANIDCYMALTFTEVSYSEKLFTFLEMRYEALSQEFNSSNWREDLMFKCCNYPNYNEPEAYFWRGYSMRTNSGLGEYRNLSEDGKTWIPTADSSFSVPYFNKTYISTSKKDSISFKDSYIPEELTANVVYEWDFEKGNFIYRNYESLWRPQKISYEEAELKFDGTFYSFTLRKNGKTEVYYLLKD